jgi:hypothetical protein
MKLSIHCRFLARFTSSSLIRGESVVVLSVWSLNDLEKVMDSHNTWIEDEYKGTDVTTDVTTDESYDVSCNEDARQNKVNRGQYGGIRVNMGKNMKIGANRMATKARMWLSMKITMTTLGTTYAKGVNRG